MTRKNLRVRTGDMVSLSQRPFSSLSKVQVIPLVRNVEEVVWDALDFDIKRYFATTRRPLHKGDLFCVYHAAVMYPVECRITNCKPYTFGFCDGKTEVEVIASKNENELDESPAIVQR